MKTLRLWTISLIALVALALPATALANSSTSGYGGPNNVVAGIQGGGGNGPTSPSADTSSPEPESEVAVQAVQAESSEGSGSGELPFTGLDVGLLAAAAGVLILLGVGLRRFTRPAQLP